jgi:hypothetical protein
MKIEHLMDILVTFCICITTLSVTALIVIVIIKLIRSI